MLPSIMSLVLAIAPMCSVAPRFAVFRPATLAPHTPGTTSGTHACTTQQMQHLDSNHYHDATSGAGPESGRVPRVHGGRSTRGLVGRTPFVLLPSSYGSTSGRGLTSCCMTAGELDPNNGLVLPPPPTRPSGARFLLSRSDAGTLIVTLPPRGVHGHAISQKMAMEIAISDNPFILYLACSMFATFLTIVDLQLLTIGSGAYDLGKSLGAAVGVPVDPVGVVVVFAGASWFAPVAFTSATLSVGEFEWEYKETVAGVITTCFRQGPVEELDIYHESDWKGDTLELITGCKKFGIGGNSDLSPIEARWVYDAVKGQVAAIKRAAKNSGPGQLSARTSGGSRFSDRPESLPRAALLGLQGAIEKALSM